VSKKYFGSVSARPEVVNNQLKLLWMEVGSEDFLYDQAATFVDLLKERKIEHKALITTGRHTWMSARLCLTVTSRLFFR
jgi:hypothetical protein